jgi:ATP-dependent exoDNAse (exonuclease V) alpha subunit
MHTFLSGEGGMGKTTLVRLLVQQWRSEGRNVLLCASSAKAARLLGGYTVHSAFKLRTTDGGFVEANLNHEQQGRHWAWLRSRDIIVIDEISMLTAGALHGVNEALNYVMKTDLPLHRATSAATNFGGKSIIAVGDLFQLPAVEKSPKMRNQVYLSTLWPTFHFVELTESCRQDQTERRFSKLLSNVRRGRSHLTTDDVALLQSRVCGSGHQPICGACTTFSDYVASRVRRRADSMEGDTRDVQHCPISENACVIAAKRAKVAELNDRHIKALATAGVSVVTAYAVDRSSNGQELHSTELRERIDGKASGQLAALPLYVGMEAVLTRNENVQGDFANGVAGVIVAVDDDLQALRFRPHGSDPSKAPLRVARRTNTYYIAGLSRVTRTQFPILPGHCLTAHRVQGATLEGEVHILLSKHLTRLSTKSSGSAHSHICASRVCR